MTLTRDLAAVWSVTPARERTRRPVTITSARFSASTVPVDWAWLTWLAQMTSTGTTNNAATVARLRRGGNMDIFIGLRMTKYGECCTGHPAPQRSDY